MWLGSDLIGVVLPNETPSVKPNKCIRADGTRGWAAFA